MCRNSLCVFFILFLALVDSTSGQIMANPSSAEEQINLDTDPHLVGWWKFDDVSGTTAVDSSGYGRDGTLKGNLSFDDDSVSGRIGKALKLDGRSDYIQIAGYKGVTGTRPRTVSAWIKTTSSRSEFISWGLDDFGQMFIFGIIRRSGIGITPNGGYLYSSSRVHDDAWHHVAAVVEEADLPNLHDDVRLYQDGELAEIHDIGLLDLWPIDTGEDLDVRIGRRLKGLIDDVRLYDRALSEDEVIALFEQQGVVADEQATADNSAFYVATNGNDANQGTKQKPFATLAGARETIRKLKKTVDKPIKVLVRAGTYYLNEPLVFTPADSGTAEAPIAYKAYPGELVTISGGRKLDCRWRPYKDGIMMCKLPDAEQGRLDFTQLFVNGKRQHLARYPNYDDSRPGRSGYIRAGEMVDDDEVRQPHPHPDADMTFSGQAPRGVHYRTGDFTKKRWAKSHEAVIHIFQAAYWGNLQWRLKDVDYENHILWFGHGGHQMGAKWAGAPSDIGQESRYYIENVFEELDAPGEWYLDKDKGILYYMPPEDIDLRTALVEAPVLQQVVRFVGTQDEPVRYITLEGFRITHTASTFLAKYDVPSLSDWAIHRGGTVFLEGARNCTIRNCWFDAVGGNAVFMNNYNRDNIVTGCKFTETGDSAICFVGDLATTVGTQRNFPYQCQAVNNLIHDCGILGKQMAGVYISRSKRITAAHNLIYDMPRAGICIGDGTWGGHIIEYNHIHDTCRETGDHGPFNAWGRDKYWCLSQSHMPYTKGRSHDAGRVKEDAMELVILRNNFFEEKSGWGLDMDDGASNYEIYNNISVGVTMKLREGAYRTVYNNIWVDSREAPCFHVGNEYNHDRYFRNITVMRGGDIYSFIAPPARGPWLEEIDYNCFYNKQKRKFTARVTEIRGEEGWPEEGLQRFSLEQWRQMGFDRHSVYADPMFVDPANNDYRVRPESLALKVGFKNFEMGKWGLTDEFPRMWRE